VTGSADVLDDRAKIKELWTSADKAFWDDANDPSIRVVRITPSAAEYWDSPGSIVTAVKLAYAGATGAKPKLGEHKKVDPAQARG
jgi:general stress protein 26